MERVGVFAATEAYKADGAYSFACWLRARADVTRADASRLGRFAGQLRTMPATEAAVASGKLSVAKARLLAGVINERTRDRFDEQEAFLVDQVQGLDVDGTKVVLGHWKRMADTDGPDPGDPSRNYARMTKEWDDRWHLDADLDPVSGALVHAVLEAIVDRVGQDGRFNGDRHIPGPERRAHALQEMAHLASGPHPDQPGVHPKIVVVVPWDRLTEPEPDPFAPQPEVVGTGPITLADLYRLATTGAASVSALTIDDQGRPLDLGRKVRLASDDQWIVLNVRDRACVVPGCDRPAGWCQAHHLEWWDRDGGPTDLSNLCLVCSAHHHLIHDQGWTLGQDPDGTWQLTRHDGTRVKRPRYPGHQRPPP